MTFAPFCLSSFIFDSISFAEAFASLVSTNEKIVFNSLPRANGIFPMSLTVSAREASRPLLIAKIPVVATSPSSKALVACVVPCAMKTTSSGAIPFLRRIFCRTLIIPSATPSLES